MRISDSMIYDQASYNMANAEEQVQTAAEVSSTGIQVTHPWDNPAAAGLAVVYQSSSANFAALAQSTQAASDELSSADAALNSIGNSISQAVTLSQEVGSGVFTAAQQAGTVAQITGIQNDIVQALNTQVGDRYIFGGTIDNAPPFSAAGAYSGNTAVRQVEIAPGIYQNASVRADVAVKGVGGGIDVFAALSALSTAVTTSNQAGILAAQGQLDTALQQVFTVQTEEGGDAAAFQTANAVNTTAQTATTTDLGDLIDANETTAASQLAQAQTAMQAAVDASQTSFQLSLVNVPQSQ
jgi:flagellar hook-associated protein 3 FlgL